MKKITLLALCCLVFPALWAAAAELPLRRIALFSSGIAYFERSGTITPPASGQTQITLSFDASEVNDVLQSLVINDPVAVSPSVRYASENTLWLTLRGLRIDLSHSPGIAEILHGLRGAELEVAAPNLIRGRIIGVEQRFAAVPFVPGFPPPAEARLSLLTPQGIRVIPVNDIDSFRFIDEAINADLNRALDLILDWREDGTRSLVVTLDGTASRNVTLSYVIPAPVWKVSYRLDLSGTTPFLQGWAIVDNDSDTDWDDVELSLVIGRPVSFIQNLFQPYRLFRPMLPLAIAGVAEGRLHEGGFEFALADQARAGALARGAPMVMEAERQQLWAAAPQAAPPAAGGVVTGVVETAEGQAAGDQFLFTMPHPVTLHRRQSAMLPLVEGSVSAERTLVFSGSRASSGRTIHPEIGAELTNTSGMPLPAGAITVYDGGIFAGNALIGFFPEGDRRFITFGEELAVTGNVIPSAGRRITAVSVSGGVMTISRRESRESLYVIRNASDEERRIVIEHPITPGTELAEPPTAEDRSAALYRFTRTVAAGATLNLTVREETPVYESITLMHLHPQAFLYFAANHEIPENVRSALNRAIELQRIAAEAVNRTDLLEAQRAWLISEQNRTRLNLEAVGIQSPQGQEFLSALVSLDNAIGDLNAQVNTAAAGAENARRALQAFLAALDI